MVAPAHEERGDESLTDLLATPTVDLTVGRQRGYIPKRRTRVSFQKGSIEKKGNGKYLLRYRVREGKSSEWLAEGVRVDRGADRQGRRQRTRSANAGDQFAKRNGSNERHAGGSDFESVQQRILGQVLEE